MNEAESGTKRERPKKAKDRVDHSAPSPFLEKELFNEELREEIRKMTIKKDQTKIE